MFSQSFKRNRNILKITPQIFFNKRRNLLVTQIIIVCFKQIHCNKNKFDMPNLNSVLQISDLLPSFYHSNLHLFMIICLQLQGSKDTKFLQ